MARISFTMTQKIECAFATDQLAATFESWLTDNSATSKGATSVLRDMAIVTISVPKGEQSYDPATVLEATSRF